MGWWIALEAMRIGSCGRAAGTLSNIVPPPGRAVPTLKEALNDPSHMVRVAAAAALYHVLGEDRWLRYLADHLKDPDPAVRRKSASLPGLTRA